jgi:hypothetical protein
MVKIECKKCGSPVDLSDEKCSNCGSPVKQKKMGYAVVVGAIVIILLILSAAFVLTKTNYFKSKPVASDSSVQKTGDTAVDRMRNGVMVIETVAKDSDDLKWVKVLLMPDEAACYRYTIKNKSGGTDTLHAVLSADGKNFKKQGDNEFEPLWKQECVDKLGREYTAEFNKSGQQQPAASSDQNAQKTDDTGINRMRNGITTIETAYKESDGLKWVKVLLMPNEAVCYRYTIKNQSGGTDTLHAVISADGKNFKKQGENEFEAVWKQECVDKLGKEYTAEFAKSGQ